MRDGVRVFSKFSIAELTVIRSFYAKRNAGGLESGRSFTETINSSLSPMILLLRVPRLSTCFLVGWTRSKTISCPYGTLTSEIATVVQGSEKQGFRVLWRAQVLLTLTLRE